MNQRYNHQTHLRAVAEKHRRNQLNAKASARNLRTAVEKARQTHTLAEIGEVLGITRQGVYDLLKRGTN